MKIQNLKPGMTVYDVGTQVMGNTRIRTVSVWSVKIEAVDEALGTVTASWNGNRLRVFTERAWKKWRLKEPMLVNVGMRQRLATRAEIAAAKNEPR